MHNGEKEFFITRHSKALGENEVPIIEYPGLNEEGLELAHKRARDLIGEIDELPINSVVWFAGCSEVPRTRSTLKIYAEDARKNYENDPEIVNFGPEEIKKDKRGIINLIKNESNKKFIVDFPLSLKDLTRKELLSDLQKGKFGKELSEIMARAGRDVDKFMEEWMISYKENEADIHSPQQSYELIVNAMNRLQRFFDKLFPDRNSMIVMVGHSTEINALLTKLIGGEISAENYKILIGKAVTETEQLILKRSKEKSELLFRGKQYEIPKHE